MSTGAEASLDGRIELKGHLDRAERMLTELVSASPDAPPDRVQEYLARCALERAATAASRGQDARATAREGLRWIDRALAVESRSPEQWAVRARLTAAAGDCAEAKRSLERAWQVNPLAKGGPDSRLAIPEIEVCAQVGHSLEAHASE